MSKYGIGQPVPRSRIRACCGGEGRLHQRRHPARPRPTRCSYGPRTPTPNIRSIDVEEAKKAPGVLAVYTGHDVVADGLGMPKANMPRKRP